MSLFSLILINRTNPGKESERVWPPIVGAFDSFGRLVCSFVRGPRVRGAMGALCSMPQTKHTELSQTIRRKLTQLDQFDQPVLIN